jgi:hypothetical protein
MRAAFTRSRKNCSGEKGARGISGGGSRFAAARAAVAEIEGFDVVGRDFVEEDFGIGGGNIAAVRPQRDPEQNG